MSPRSEEKGKGKAFHTRFIVEEVLDSYIFIPMPLLSQVPRPPMHLTPLLVHHTPPPMHSTSSIFRSFTGLLSTPYFSSLSPISVIGFISPPEYTHIMHPNTPHPTYFPMPSMYSSIPSFLMSSSSGPSFLMPSMQPFMPYMEASGSSMPHLSHMHSTPDE